MYSSRLTSFSCAALLVFFSAFGLQIYAQKASGIGHGVLTSTHTSAEATDSSGDQKDQTSSSDTQKINPPQGDTQTSPARATSPGTAATGASLSRPAGNAAGTEEGAGRLSFHGITFYGNIDIGAQHQTHGATYDENAPQTGLEQVINKNSNHALTHYSQNGLSQSVLGVRGDEKIKGGVSLIFKLEPGIEPLDCIEGVKCFTNSIQSLVNNNGVAQDKQTANFDTNRAGRIDNGEAYFGLANTGEDHFETLTFGRVLSLFSDKVSKYDFDSGSYAFSLVSYIGIVSGGGDSEDLRMDSTLKFTSQFGPYRVAALTQLSGHNPVFQPDGVYGKNQQLDLGYDYRKRASVDVLYAGVRDGISATPLTAAQTLTLPKNSLAATISDNTAYAVMGRYSLDRSARTRVFSGYSHIRFRNPIFPLKPGITDIGGYVLSTLTQNAYTHNKILQAFWVGAQYSITPRLTMSGGYYTFRQNSFGTTSTSCSSSSSATCSGSLNVLPLVFAYKLNKHLDLYVGSEGSFVTNGYSSGYLYTSTVTNTIGGRFHF
jgi:predicted porin